MVGVRSPPKKVSTTAKNGVSIPRGVSRISLGCLRSSIGGLSLYEATFCSPLRGLYLGSLSIPSQDTDQACTRKDPAKYQGGGEG